MFAHAVGAAGQGVPWDTGPPPWGAGNAVTHLWREHPKISLWHLADFHRALSLENRAKKLIQKLNIILTSVSSAFPWIFPSISTPCPLDFRPQQYHPSCSAATARPHLQESLGGPWALIRCPRPLKHVVPGSCWIGSSNIN